MQVRTCCTSLAIVTISSLARCADLGLLIIVSPQTLALMRARLFTRKLSHAMQ